MRIELAPGDIVLSLAGRDEGRFFVVMEIVDAEYVTICDGSLRKADKPKKKKRKHIRKTGARAGLVANKLADGVRVTNPDLRRALSEYMEANPR